MEKQKLPNAIAVLILGIGSILTCCCYGVVGLILAIIALVIAKKDVQAYKENPENYSNYSTLNTGRILAIIGIILNIISIAYFIWILSVLGTDALQNPQLLQEKIRSMQQN